MKIGVNIGHFGTVGAVGFLDEVKCCTDINGYLVPYLKAAGHEGYSNVMMLNIPIMYRLQT